jgi:hypothetical protein
MQLLERRYGDDRPGMRLLGIEPAAIPVTIVRTDVLAQERKHLPIIEEFVLRFVLEDVRSPADIAVMLGLDEDQILDSVAVQISEHNLSRTHGGDLTLTSRGRETARTLAATQPVVKQIPIVFDRLVWNVVDYAKAELLTKREAQERGFRILPALRSARIGLGDVSVPDLNQLLKERGGKERLVEILRVRKVMPSSHRYMPAELLVYGDADRGEAALGLCIEGEIQPTHSLRLEAVNAIERLGISIGEPLPAPELDRELEQQRVGAEEVEALRARADQEGATDTDLRTTGVRNLSVFEHADLLEEALGSARERLLIISPWIRSAVVSTEFLAMLESRLRARVHVTIAHGYGDNDEGSDAYAVKRLSNLAARYPKYLDFARLRNTHAKILIFDSNWVSTSFNWLSFRGDPSRTYRMEEGTLVRIPKHVDRAYEHYTQLIAEQRVA